MKTFGEKLKQAMQKLHLNQIQVSGLTGKSKGSISQYLSDKQVPPEETQVDIALALGLAEDYFSDKNDKFSVLPTKEIRNKIIPRLDINEARVFGNAWVYGDARVSENAWVYGDARVSGDARVFDNAWVYGNAKVYGDARVSGNAWVYGNAEVFNTRHFFVQGPIGSRDGYVTFYRTKDDTVEVRCGCFSGSLQEFVNQVEETHGGSRYEKEYKLAAELAKVCIRLEGESR